MRILACVLAAGVLLVPSAAATPAGLKLLVRDGRDLSLVYLDRATPFEQPLKPLKPAPLAFSGDGRLVSVGGTIVGRATLPAAAVAWAPTGERAAYVTHDDAVGIWTPRGAQLIGPRHSGAWGLAWGPGGALAIGKGAYVWVRRNGTIRRVAGPAPFDTGTGGPGRAVPFAWSGGQVLWWAWPGSGSVAADGVSLFLGTRKLGTTLMYPDYVAACGPHLAWISGGDRESMDNKKIVFDGRDVSGGAQRSWSTPACTPGGRLVAAASRNLIPARTDETHRAIWQLLPARKRLTHPPWGWSDEDPRLFPDGTLLFVRTRAYGLQAASGYREVQKGRVMLLEQGKLHEVAEIGFNQPQLGNGYPLQYSGHYDWTYNLAVAP